MLSLSASFLANRLVRHALLQVISQLSYWHFRVVIETNFRLCVADMASGILQLQSSTSVRVCL
jgi:hypothetical protein